MESQINNAVFRKPEKSKTTLYRVVFNYACGFNNGLVRKLIPFGQLLLEFTDPPFQIRNFVPEFSGIISF